MREIESLSRAGNSYFARIYRDDWVGPRPELRRPTVHKYKDDRWDSPGYYYQVYLPIVDTAWKQDVPSLENRQPYELHKLTFKDHDEEQEQRTLAYDMAQGNAPTHFSGSPTPRQ